MPRGYKENGNYSGKVFQKGHTVNLGRYPTEETRKKMRINHKGMSGKKQSVTTRRKISGTRIKKGLSKGKNSFFYGKPTPHGKGAYYKGTWMRSSWEIRIAQLLDKARIFWQYEIRRFILEDLTYCPDFYLPKWNLWVEVKGWMSPKSKERIKQFRELYPEENLLIIDENLYKKYCEVKQ